MKSKFKKWAAALGLGLMMVSAAAMGIHAEDIAVYTDGLLYDGEVRLINQSTYVGLREFSCAVDNSVVSWDGGTNTASVSTDSLKLTAANGGSYLIANGRYLWCSEGIFTDNGVLYVPLRTLSKAFGFRCRWNGEDNSVHLTRERGALVSADSYYHAEDIYWLSRIIHAEAQGEPFLGKLAVGTVILNRTEAEQFPDNLYDVIFDRTHGVQFTPTVNGQIYNIPGEDSVIAAKLCLDGYRLSDSVLYFLNPRLASSFWIPNNCTFVASIGGHDFYS